MRLDPIVGDIGNDPKLRYVVEQLNRRLQFLNENQSDTDSSLDLKIAETEILVNKDGDVLTNDSGEVLLNG